MSKSTRIKELNEKRGSALKNASEIVSKAAQEKRELTADELQKVEGFHAEAEQTTKTIEVEARQLALESQGGVKLTPGEERDVAKFDLAATLRHLHRVVKGQPSQLTGIEAEMVAEGEKEARAAGLEVGGIMLPRILVRKQGFDPERRDMSVTGGTNTQYGGDLVATEKRGLADDFYNASILRANGAMVLEGLQGNLSLPRYTKATNPTKKAENAAADELSPTIDDLALTPRRLPAYIDISELLLKQSSAVLETFLRQALVNQLLDVQEVAFFHGGGTNEPTGIAATAGIGSVAGGTNGAAPDWADIVGLESAVGNVNAAMGNLRYLTNTKVRGKLKQTPVVASTDSRMIWDINAREINGTPVAVTNAVSSTLTKGSASGICSAIFYGNVSDFVIGYWGGISLEMVRDKTNAISGLYTLVASAYYDGGVYRPKSFAAMLDALTT